MRKKHGLTHVQGNTQLSFQGALCNERDPQIGVLQSGKKNWDKGEENLHKTVEVKRTRKNPEKRIQDKSENSVRLSDRKKSWGKDKKIFGEKTGGNGRNSRGNSWGN